MTGCQRILAVLRGEPVDRLPMLPILHTGLAGPCGVALGDFFTRADVMADVLTEGVRRFGFDGVQLTLGVTGEAEALGAAVEQPADGGPVLREHLLADPGRLDVLRARDPTQGGRMPLFFDAVARASRRVAGYTFVLATLRGPLLVASQLRGVEEILIDLIERPDLAERILDFTCGVIASLARALRPAGAHGLLLGEATCSPNFISPDLYRQTVLPRHRRLVSQLKADGWPFVGLHVCGNIVPIFDDLISTGVDFFDVDYQVPAARAVELAAGRVALRGNLDPSGGFRFGTAEQIRAETTALCAAVTGARWIAGSGCDIPPGTPAANLAAFAEVVRGYTE